jgi:hypothetical protein
MEFLSEFDSYLPDDSSRSRFSMISLSSSVVFFVDLMLTDEFASLDEPPDASRVVVFALSCTDGSGSIESERQVEPRGPTRKLRLPIVRFVACPKLAKIGARVGECGRKSMVPKVIWFSPEFGLSAERSEKAVKFMTLMSKLPTVGAN